MRMATSASRMARSSSLSSSSSVTVTSGIAVKKFADRGASQASRRPRVVVTFSRPGRLFLAFRQQRLGHGQLGEHLARGAVQQLALLGQDQPARVPVEQRHLQALLERAESAGSPPIG